MRLALFDFDGTISSKDSFLLFLWFTSKYRFLRTCLYHFPEIMLFLLKRYPNHKLKEAFLAGVLQGVDEEELGALAAEFCTKVLPRIIREGFWDSLREHQRQNHTVVVVSATPQIILEPWCREQGIEIIATRLEITLHQGVTGRIVGRNCRGEEKVRRLEEHFDLEHSQVVFVYGDSDGDDAMLSLVPAEKRYFKPFR